MVAQTGKMQHSTAQYGTGRCHHTCVRACMQEGSGRTVGVVSQDGHGLLAQFELLQFESGEPVPEPAINGACEGSEAEESSPISSHWGSHI